VTGVDYVFAGYYTGSHDLPAELIAARTTYQRLASHQIPPAPALDGFRTATEQLLTAARTGGELLIRVDQAGVLAEQQAANIAGQALRAAQDQAKAELEALVVDVRDDLISNYLQPAFLTAVDQARADGPAVRNTGSSALAAAKPDAKTRGANVRFDKAVQTYALIRYSWSQLVMVSPVSEFADRLPVLGEIRNVPQAWPEFSPHLSVQHLRQQAPWLTEPNPRSRLLWLANHPEVEVWLPTPAEFDALIRELYRKQLEAAARAHWAGQAVPA
jgi:hypothetical protein